LDAKISTGTIVRTICLVLALVNQILSSTGHAVLPIEDTQVETIVTTVITIVTSVIAWWKNNSISTAAIKADEYMHKLKNDSK